MRFHILAALMCLLTPAIVACAAESTRTPAAQGGDAGTLLAQKGKAASTIVLPDKPLPVEQYAADELAKHVRLATGAALPIVREGQLKQPVQAPIYIGNVQALREIQVAPKAAEQGGGTTIARENARMLAPDYSSVVKLPDGGEMISGANGAPPDDAVNLVLDLGEARDVDALSVVNRPDIATNYNVRRVKIQSSARDDGQTWDETLYEGDALPAVNEAGAVRAMKFAGVKRRYFRVSILSNFWGKVADAANANTQLMSWKEWRYSAAKPAAKKAAADLLQLDKLEPNAFLVRTNGDALFLAGRDDDGDPLRDDVNAGTLFAVYEWLEKQAGVHWLWPGDLGTSVQSASTLRAGNWNLRAQPPFVHTRWRQMFGRELYVQNKNSYTPAQRAELAKEETVWMRRNRFARGVSLEYAHGFEDYWERFGKTHPEYFNLLPDGTHRPDPLYNGGQGYTISTAWANGGFQDQVIADWQKNRTAIKPWINGAENDTNNLDTSPQAMAWDARDPALGDAWNNRLELTRAAFEKKDPSWFTHLGSMSDRYAKFLLALQEKGRKTDPKARVLGYAYANYSLPPLETKLNRDLIFAIVPNYMWPLTPQTHELFKSQWLGWSNAGASLYYRPNYTLSGNNLPINYARQVAKDFQLAAQNHMIATDLDALTSMWATQGPTLYTIARLHWRPDWPVDKILDEYYAGFGPAKSAVQKYFDFWQKRTDEQAARIAKGELAGLAPAQGGGQLFSNWQEIHRVAGVLFPPEDFKTAGAFLDAAEKAVAKDPVFQKRVAFLRAGWNDARLTAEASLLAPGMKNNDSQAFTKTLSELDAHRRMEAREFPHAINLDLEGWVESRHWGAARSLSGALAGVQVVRNLPLDWEMRWDEKNVGTNEKWYTDFKPGADWQPVRVDAAWENQAVGQKWKAAHGKDYDGLAWYRVRFNLPENLKGQRLALLFGAVDESATVYLNGQKIGEHLFKDPDDWQTPFEIEITDAAKFGGENELSVLVEDKVGLGGVWQPVWVIKAR